MRAVRSVVVVEALPHGKLRLEVHVVLVGEERVELVFVGSMRSFDLSVELRRSRFDVDVFHARVGDVPVEERLELVAAIGSDRLDSKRELLHDVIDKVDGVRLRVTLVDLQRPHPRRVIDGRVRVASNRRALFPLQGQELDVDLHVMARDLLLVAFGRRLRPCRLQTRYTVASEVLIP